MVRIRLAAVIIGLWIVGAISPITLSPKDSLPRRSAEREGGSLPPSGGRTREADGPRADQIRPEPNRGGAVDMAS